MGSIESIEAVLRRGRNADLGWGYYFHKRSRLEPTCWALLALRDADPQALRNWPIRDGLLLENADGEPNYAFHGLAMLALSARQVEHVAGNHVLLDAIQRVRGVKLSPSTVNRQDNGIQGWSWIADTFSWVEPTAWCLLALKKWLRRLPTRVNAKRIADAEALLFDRCCVGGGWNYGNANMLGKELKPYVPTTAIALLSLLDRPSAPAVVKSREYLTREALSEKSSVALSLALLALRLLGQRSDAVVSDLTGQLETTAAVGNQFAIALALYALRSSQDDNAFKL
jgi:hypothetical protein